MSALAKEYDVVVVGGGAVGLSLACGLAQRDMSVAVVEARPHEYKANNTNNVRTIAVSHGGMDFLSSLDCWRDLEPLSCAMRFIAVSDGVAQSVLRFDCAEVGVTAFGFITPYHALMDELSKKSVEAGVHIIKGRAAAYLADEARATVTLEDDTYLRARLVVAADGRASVMRHLAGVRVTQRDYQQRAVTATVHHERAHHHTAWELLRPHGALALLPLRGGFHSSLIWSLPHKSGASLADNPQRLAELLNEAASDIFGKLSIELMGVSVPLSLVRAQRVVASRLILAGDAAQALHPIAGQGLNLGWRDAHSIIRMIEQKQKLGLDIADDMALASYEKTRALDRKTLMMATHALNLCFEEGRVLRSFMGMGLFAVDAVPWLKRPLMRYAMGGHH